MKNTDAAITVESLLAQAGRCRPLLRALLRDDDTADDVAQEAVIAGLSRPPRDDAGVGAWFRTIVLNRVRSAGRSESRRRAREAVAQQLASGDPARTPEEEVLMIELQKLVMRFLLELDEPFRRVLSLRFLEQREPSEIARLLGCPAGTVRWRLKVGLDQLRQQLSRETGERWEKCRALVWPVPAFRPRSRPFLWGLAMMGTGALGAAVYLIAPGPVASGAARRPADVAASPASRPTSGRPGPSVPRFVLASASADEARASDRNWTRTAPFTALRWRGSAAEVEVDGRWHAWLAVDGQTVDDLIAYARTRYGASWRKRLAEDLFDVLSDQGHAPFGELELHLRSLETGKTSKVRRPLSPENRRLVWEAANRAPFDSLCWRGEEAIIKIEGRSHALLAIDGVPLAALRAQAQQEDPHAGKKFLAIRLVELMGALGHPPGDAVSVQVRSLASGREARLPNVPMTNERWVKVLRSGSAPAPTCAD